MNKCQEPEMNQDGKGRFDKNDILLNGDAVHQSSDKHNRPILKHINKNTYNVLLE